MLNKLLEMILNGLMKLERDTFLSEQARYLLLYIDAINAKVPREHVSSEAFYVVIGLTETIQREVLPLKASPPSRPPAENGFWESSKSTDLSRRT